MLTLIHGEDIVTSRKILLELVEKYVTYEKIQFDGAKITLTDLVSTSDSLSLFSKDKLIIIENLLSGTVSKEKEAILKYLEASKMAPVCIIWEQKELTKTQIKKYFNSAKVIFSPLPAYLFKFLDAIGIRSADEILSMSNMLLKQHEADFLLSMLIRQWRFLIIGKDLGQKGFMQMPSWQSIKFIRQAESFKLDKLINSYRSLLSLDQKIKTGQTSYNLNQLLDIFFISLYHQN